MGQFITQAKPQRLHKWLGWIKVSFRSPPWLPIMWHTQLQEANCQRLPKEMWSMCVVLLLMLMWPCEQKGKGWPQRFLHGRKHVRWLLKLPWSRYSCNHWQDSEPWMWTHMQFWGYFYFCFPMFPTHWTWLCAVGLRWKLMMHVLRDWSISWAKEGPWNTSFDMTCHAFSSVSFLPLDALWHHLFYLASCLIAEYHCVYLQWERQSPLRAWASWMKPSDLAHTFIEWVWIKSILHTVNSKLDCWCSLYLSGGFLRLKVLLRWVQV